MVRRSPRSLVPLTLLTLLPALSSCTSSGTGDDVLPPPHDVAIVLGARQAGSHAFSPGDAVVSLASQNTVTWYNADFFGQSPSSGTAHRLKSDDGTSFDSGVIEPGELFQTTFTTPGTHTYHCEFHSGMTGSVTINP